MKAVRCETQEQFNRVLEYAEKQGWRWNDGDVPNSESKNYWSRYEDKTYIRLGDKFSFGHIGYLEGENYIPFDEFEPGTIVEQAFPTPGRKSCTNAEFLLKQIPLHLEDPKRVWAYSGHECEPAIAKGIRMLHDEIERLNGELSQVKRENEVLSDKCSVLESELEDYCKE